MIDFIYLTIGLVTVILAGEFLLRSAVSASNRLNIPRIIVGMTIVSFATSLPELITSIRAAVDGYADLSVSNVVGSNIANLGFVLGIVLLFGQFTVQKSFYKSDWPILFSASVLLLLFVLDGQVNRLEGIILVSGLVAFIVYLIKFKSYDIQEGFKTNKMKWSMIVLLTVLGSMGLSFGSQWLVNGAVGIARTFQVSERIIGITLISIGTSLPELVASIIAVIKKEQGISIGNLIGSNIFNIFTVLGITAIIQPLNIVDLKMLDFDIWVMMFFTILLLPLVFFPKKMKLGWREGIILLGCYLVYIFITLK